MYKDIYLFMFTTHSCWPRFHTTYTAPSPELFTKAAEWAQCVRINNYSSKYNEHFTEKK